jgi:CRP-like cAMP-binding protein
MSFDLADGNALLRVIEADVRPCFEGRLRVAELEREQILYSLGTELDRVYFPVSGLIGIRAETAEGEFIESAIVGREGAIGAFEACGSRQYFAEAAVQVPGRALQMSAATYRELFEASPALRNAVHRYVEQLLSETRQFVVCNSLHAVEERLGRTLLEALEKSGLDDTLPLTQQALARMLGAQRTTVAQVVSRLQRDQVLNGSRGTIRVVDRAALEAVACSCRVSLRETREAIAGAAEPACDAVIAA